MTVFETLQEEKDKILNHQLLTASPCLVWAPGLFIERGAQFLMYAPTVLIMNLIQESQEES